MNALTTTNETNFNDLISLCTHLAKSGMFADARDASKALVKVLAGKEYGFGAIASMMGIHIIDGRPSLGANLLASLIVRSGKYTYKIISATRTKCEIAFFEDKQPCGPNIAMTIEEAKKNEDGTPGIAIGRDGKLKTNWSKHPDDMLFARCISKGYRRYCPDLAGGIVTYTQDEIDQDEPEQVIVTSVQTNGTTEQPQSPVEQTASEPTPAQPSPKSDFVTKDIFDAELKPVMQNGYEEKLRPILGVPRWGEVPTSWLPLLKEVCTKIREPLEFQALYLNGKSLKECDLIKLGLALNQLRNMEGSKP